MAIPTISTSFVTAYEDAAKLAYQRQGAKLRNTVRISTGVVGSTDIFQKIGKGVANTKARHADIDPMNLAHSTATATLADYFAGEYLAQEDVTKFKHDEKGAIGLSAGYALGRTTDSLIITALSGVNAAMKVEEGGTGLTRNKIFTALELLETNDVPSDGNLFAAVGPHQWSELLAIPEFSDADYVGGELPWVKNRDQARMWAGVWWMKHTGLTLTTGVRYCYIWHKWSIGLAEGSGVGTTWSWENTKNSFFCNANMSLGAVLIDGGSDGGVVQIACDDDAVIA